MEIQQQASQHSLIEVIRPLRRWVLMPADHAECALHIAKEAHSG